MKDGACTYPFKNRQIGHHAARVKMLETTENNMITVIRDLLIVVARIDSTANKVIILKDQLLRAVMLLIRANHGGSP